MSLPVGEEGSPECRRCSSSWNVGEFRKKFLASLGPGGTKDFPKLAGCAKALWALGLPHTHQWCSGATGVGGGQQRIKALLWRLKIYQLGLDG